MTSLPRTAAAGLLAFSILAAPSLASPEKPWPDRVGEKPPHGAIILFDGKDLSQWVRRDNKQPSDWAVKDGYMEVKPSSDIVTKQEFGDYLLHVEFWIPPTPDTVTSQAKGNSGVYNHGRYEIQVLDSFNNTTYADGMCGAIYEQKPPDINACKPAGQWQSYDITFRGPRFDSAGKETERPRVTVYHNGILIHSDVEITKEFTRAGIGGAVPKTGPILLQNHGNPVRFRNIWIVPKR